MAAKRTCSVEGCTANARCKGWCKMHYTRWVRTGSPVGLKRSPAKLTLNKGYYLVGKKAVHTSLVEAVLGKQLSPGACIHHVDEDKTNNAKSNLVVCPSHAYHMLLHRRMRAQAATGNPNLRKCCICKEWDHPDNLYFPPSTYVGKHKQCDAKYHAIIGARKRNTVSKQQKPLA